MLHFDDLCSLIKLTFSLTKDYSELIKRASVYLQSQTWKEERLLVQKPSPLQTHPGHWQKDELETS